MMDLSAAPVVAPYLYPSTITSDAHGPLDLVAELNYDDSRSHAPIAVVMHGYSGTTGKLGEVRGNAQHLRDKGFFAVSVAMRQRDGSDGVRDSGGLEIYDIYDAVEAVKADYPGLVNPEIVYLTGYSGGGGNTLAAVCKFPNAFNAAAAFFGMSDYGYNTTHGWYYDGASISHQAQMRTDIGDPALGSTNVTDRYHARASNRASANNPYTEIHLFVNASETTCPPVNDTSFVSNAVSRAVFAGEFTNMTVHIGASGLYQDFNTNGVNDADEQQVWPHGAPTHDQQDAAENWFMTRLLAGQLPRRTLNASDTLHVAGFVKTSRFECHVGDGQEGMIQLDYALASTGMTFQASVLSLDKTRTSRLAVDTSPFSNQTVDVWLNGARAGSFVGGGKWTLEELRDGDTLELLPAGPALFWLENAAMSSVSATSAWASVTLSGTNSDLWCYWGTSNAGPRAEGWWRDEPLGYVPTGRVTTVLADLQPATAYYAVFCASNAATGAIAWSDVATFQTARDVCKLLAYYRFDSELADQSTNAFDGVSVTSGGAGVLYTNHVPAALASTSHEAAVFDGKSWVTLPFLNLYSRAQTNGLTISFWVRAGSSISSWMFAEGCTTNTPPAYCFGPKVGVQTFRAFIRTDANSGRLDRQSAGAVFDSAWHHVVWTDSKGTARLYIDGALDAVSQSYAPGTLTMNTTTIGALERKPGDLMYPFVGLIDDLSVWGEVLSTNGIAALSAGVSPLELAGRLSDPAQPVQITEMHAADTPSLSFVFTGPTLAAQPRVWYATNLSSAAWSPVAVLTETTWSNGVYRQSYGGVPSGAATFFKVVY
jgi:dienelactone hydrolase